MKFFVGNNIDLGRKGGGVETIIEVQSFMCKIIDFPFDGQFPVVLENPCSYLSVLPK